MSAARHKPNAESAQGVLSRHRLLFISLCGVLLILFVLFALASVSSREKGLVLGARKFRMEFDADDSQAEFFTHVHSRPNPIEGDFESEHDFTLRMPSGVLKFSTEYDPAPLIQKRLPADIPGLIALLASRNAAEAYCAAEALAEHEQADVSILPMLIFAAESNNTLFDAIERISLNSPKLAVPALIKGLVSTNLNLKAWSAAILGQIGTNAVAAVPALLDSFKNDPNIQPCIASALFDITGDVSATLPTLRGLLAGPSNNYFIKHAVLRTLDHFQSYAAPALPEVLAIARPATSTNGMTSYTLDLQSLALKALSRICTNAAHVLPTILAVLEVQPPPHLNLRSNAISFLGALGSAGLPHLIDLYKGTNRQDSAAAAKSLAEMGSTAAGFLNFFETDLRSTNQDRVILACEIIGSFGERASPAVPTLTNLLHVPNRQVRIHAAAALTRLGHFNETIIRVLVDFLGERSNPLNFGGNNPALQTLAQILRTNAEAKIIFEERLATNPRAARYLQDHKNTLKRYGLPPPW